MTREVSALLARLDNGQRAINRRDKRYRGVHDLRYATTDIDGDLKHFGVNLCALAVDAVAERMRIQRFRVLVGNRDVTQTAVRSWTRSHMDQRLMPLLVDVLALGAAYLVVWPTAPGRPVITPESARHMVCTYHPVTREVTGAVKRWAEYDEHGVLVGTHVVHYGPTAIVHYRQPHGSGKLVELSRVHNPLGVVPVVPLVNVQRIGDEGGTSVIDDLAHLVDALGKLLADMLVASEDVARPRRWATGVDLDDDDEDDGFIADEDPAALDDDDDDRPAVSPFDSGNRMFTVESPDAKFGQLPGADLAGYKTGVELVLQQIMAVSALPAHMMGITTSNPASADAIRSAEASLTARAESRISVLGIGLERALALAVAFADHVDPDDVEVRIRWANPATRSTAQEADAVTKLFSLGIMDLAEARELMGLVEL